MISHGVGQAIGHWPLALVFWINPGWKW